MCSTNYLLISVNEIKLKKYELFGPFSPFICLSTSCLEKQYMPPGYPSYLALFSDWVW